MSKNQKRLNEEISKLKAEVSKQRKKTDEKRSFHAKKLLERPKLLTQDYNLEFLKD